MGTFFPWLEGWFYPSEEKKWGITGPLHSHSHVIAVIFLGFCKYFWSQQHSTYGGGKIIFQWWELACLTKKRYNLKLDIQK